MSTPLTSQDLFPFEGELEVQLSADQMSVSLTYFPSAESQEADTDKHEFNKETIVRFLESRGITFGILDDVISQFAANPASFAQKEFMVAEGRAAVAGDDSYLEMLCYSSNQSKPKVKRDGSVDFYSMTNIANVAKGQILGKKIPSTEGRDGMTVRGEILSAKAGKDLPLKAGKNVVIDRESQALYAALDGQVSITNVINVFPVFEVNGDLDLSVGNIDFVGNVVIRGSVPSGFKIVAKGDVRITGGVEGAEIISDGSIHIQSGITGQHKGLVKAGLDIQTGFIVNGTVQAEGNVLVSQSIMHSHVMAGEQVECKGDKGLIVGGHIQAGKAVICHTIGNSMTTSTTVEVGSQPKALNRKREIEKEFTEIRDTLDKTAKAEAVLHQIASKLGQLPADKQQMLIKLTNTKLENENRWRDLKEEMAELEQELQNSEQCKIVASKTLYAGTKIILGKYMKYIKDTQTRIEYVLENSLIVGKPLI
ncbi:FapA family protein [Bacillus horti]|uniref:Uncharacterized protein (DUF342 family) n=1 Tax=Caldalkalibacillus horti TaxID=77523 RepID=A0ABT9VUY1_9BACI|nr:FapA family protein [Bacillus horti]MDQ0164690.1 uncharacterized protein (DUF342 family) [Bacillus horti]